MRLATGSTHRCTGIVGLGEWPGRRGYLGASLARPGRPQARDCPICRTAPRLVAPYGVVLVDAIRLTICSPPPHRSNWRRTEISNGLLMPSEALVLPRGALPSAT